MCSNNIEKQNKEFPPGASATVDHRGTVARCEHCGHTLPSENLALHVAACHSGRDRGTASMGTRRRHATAGPASPATGTITTSAPTNNVRNRSTAEPDMIQCDKCGRYVSALSATAHDAACYRQPRQVPLEADEGGIETVAIDSTATTRQAGTSRRTALPLNGETSASVETYPSSSSSAPEHAAQTSPQEWSCPQCTLLNLSTESRCQACGFYNYRQNTNQSQNATTTTPAVQIEVQEMDPRVVNTVLTATNALWWSLLGAMVAGPAGAAVCGTAGALLSGASLLRNNRRTDGQRPRVTMVSTRSNNNGITGAATTMMMTNHAGGRWRTVTMRTPMEATTMAGPGDLNREMASPIDQVIRRMLVVNAMSQGENNVDQMTYEELLERFGVGTEHRRGASPETIRSIPINVLNDGDAVAELHENQKVCNICLEAFKQGDEMRTLQCKHNYHRQCIDRWLAQVASCPICKQEIQNSRR